MTTKFFDGKTLEKLMIADDQKALLFKCVDGVFIAKADGDCCTESWIESVEMPALGLPAKILSIKSLDLPGSVDNSDDYEVLDVFGYCISTDKGDIVIDFRCSHNGFYGGNMSWPDDKHYYGGVYNQNVSTENWIEIKDE